METIYEAGEGTLNEIVRVETVRCYTPSELRAQKENLTNELSRVQALIDKADELGVEENGGDEVQ